MGQSFGVRRHDAKARGLPLLFRDQLYYEIISLSFLEQDKDYEVHWNCIYYFSWFDEIGLNTSVAKYKGYADL